MEAALISRKAPMSILLGIIFDTSTKKILIAKRKNPSRITGLTWCFPGGRIEFKNAREDLDKLIKNRLKEKTGLDVESLGSVFAEAYSAEEGLLSIYYLCEITGGKEKICDEFEEFRWVSPKEIEKHFSTSLHPNLKEYLINLA
ncbi:MAG: NUDIX hydrolase [Nanoarchaeota archaeon]